METRDLKAAIGKPQVQKLKALGKGIRVSRVLGRRVLVKTVIPYTEADEVEKKGLLVVPEWVKKENTPLPSTGIVVTLGDECTEQDRNALCEGAMVLFSKYAGSDVIVEEENFRVLEVPEIMAVLEDVEKVIAPVVENYDARV